MFKNETWFCNSFKSSSSLQLIGKGDKTESIISDNLAFISEEMELRIFNIKV